MLDLVYYCSEWYLIKENQVVEIVDAEKFFASSSIHEM